MGGIYLGNALLTHSTVENIIQDNDFYIKADANNINWADKEIYTLNISEPTNFTLNDMLVAKQEYRDIILQINNLDTNGVKTTNYLILESFDANSLINQFINDNFIASINNNSTITIRQNKMTSIIETNKGLKQKFWRGTKEEYEALDVKDEDTMYIVINEEGSSIKADWNENDAEAPNYIENRTHYREFKNATLMDNQEINIWSGGYASIQEELMVILNSVYDITLDGVLYSCIASEVYDEEFYAIVLGNTEYFASFENAPPNNGEPFCIVIHSDGETEFYGDGNLYGTHILSISGLTEVFTKIDKNYLPNSNIINGTGTYSVVEGYHTSATGDWGSHAEGYESVASGQNSHAEGYGSEASNYSSHAEGWWCEASGHSSHAEGNTTHATNDGSHAEGYETKASGRYSHAEGYITTASGDYSHAEGHYTTASKDYSHAEGRYTDAYSEYQHVQGKYNISDADNVYAHIVGNGTSPTLSGRSNAHTLDWDGNAWFAGDVYVGSTSGTNKDEGSVKLATIQDIDKSITLQDVEIKLPLSSRWMSICYGDDKFVAVGNNRKAAYSIDGFIWHQTDMPSYQRWMKVVYGNGKFVALSYLKIAYSTDGITWNEVAAPSKTSGNHSWSDLAYGNGVFVITAKTSTYSDPTSDYAYSTDGINWTKSNLPVAQSYPFIAYGNGKFITCSGGAISSSRIYYSEDGINWSYTTVDNTISARGISYVGDKFIITTSGAPLEHVYSTDGITWNEMSIGLNLSFYLPAFGYGNGMYVAVITQTTYKNIHYNGIAFYSSDGITWTQTTMPFICSGDVAYGNGKFIALHNYLDQYDVSTDTIMYSEDGINWKSEMPQLQTIGGEDVTADTLAALNIQSMLNDMATISYVDSAITTAIGNAIAASY